MFSQVVNTGASQALEAALRFAGQRQRIIAHNIANITTPNFIQQDVSVSAFQNSLREAIDRRASAGGLEDLVLSGNSEVEMGADGTITLNPSTPHGGILFQDRNNRDLEMLMQDNVENGTMFRVCSDLLKNRSDLMRAAIAERI